jgi:hypothetical protein
VRSNRSAKKTKFLSYLRKTAQGLAQTLYYNREIAALSLQARSSDEKRLFSSPFLVSQRSVTQAKGASGVLPANMLFFSDTRESVLFFTDTIGFFAMKLWIAANLRSFHFALSLELTLLAQRVTWLPWSPVQIAALVLAFRYTSPLCF